MDKINQYINDKYVKTDNNKDRIKMKDIFNEFKNSMIYDSMTSKEQKELTFKNFKKLLSDNPSFKFLIIKTTDLFLSNYKIKLSVYEEIKNFVKDN
jgi:hypothetical protein